MFTEGMVNFFLNVHMVDWDDEIETRSGYKDVSKALYTYAYIMYLLIN